MCHGGRGLAERCRQGPEGPGCREPRHPYGRRHRHRTALSCRRRVGAYGRPPPLYDPVATRSRRGRRRQRHRARRPGEWRRRPRSHLRGRRSRSGFRARGRRRVARSRAARRRTRPAAAAPGAGSSYRPRNRAPSCRDRPHAAARGRGARPRRWPRSRRRHGRDRSHARALAGPGAAHRRSRRGSARPRARRAVAPRRCPSLSRGRGQRGAGTGQRPRHRRDLSAMSRQGRPAARRRASCRLVPARRRCRPCLDDVQVPRASPPLGSGRGKLRARASADTACMRRPRGA